MRRVVGVDRVCNAQTGSEESCGRQCGGQPSDRRAICAARAGRHQVPERHREITAITGRMRLGFSRMWTQRLALFQNRTCKLPGTALCLGLHLASIVTPFQTVNRICKSRLFSFASLLKASLRQFATRPAAPTESDDRDVGECGRQRPACAVPLQLLAASKFSVSAEATAAILRHKIKPPRRAGRCLVGQTVAFV